MNDHVHYRDLERTVSELSFRKEMKNSSKTKKVYPMINMTYFDEMSEEMRHALNCFEAENVLDPTKECTYDEVIDFLQNKIQDTSEFNLKFLCSVP